MANEEKNLTHNIIMENRKTLSISGVTDVDNFDEKTILLYTQMGELTVQGKGLHDYRGRYMVSYIWGERQNFTAYVIRETL